MIFLIPLAVSAHILHLLLQYDRAGADVPLMLCIVVGLLFIGSFAAVAHSLVSVFLRTQRR